MNPVIDKFYKYCRQLYSKYENKEKEARICIKLKSGKNLFYISDKKICGIVKISENTE